MRAMRTGEVAEQSGVNIETLRYYERRGLLQPPPRQPSGYREYTTDAVRIVRFVKRAQELGFTLEEVESLLDLAAGGPRRCESARAVASQRLADLDAKMRSLRAMQRSLQRLIATCEQPRSRRDCPLLETLSGDTV